MVVDLTMIQPWFNSSGDPDWHLLGIDQSLYHGGCQVFPARATSQTSSAAANLRRRGALGYLTNKAALDAYCEVRCSVAQ